MARLTLVVYTIITLISIYASSKSEACALHPDRDISTGKDILQTRTSNPSDCCTLCRQNIQCKAFVYGYNTNPYNCFLKDNIRMSIPSPGLRLVAGVSNTIWLCDRYLGLREFAGKLPEEVFKLEPTGFLRVCPVTSFFLSRGAPAPVNNMINLFALDLREDESGYQIRMPSRNHPGNGVDIRAYWVTTENFITIPNDEESAILVATQELQSCSLYITRDIDAGTVTIFHHNRRIFPSSEYYNLAGNRKIECENRRGCHVVSKLRGDEYFDDVLSYENYMDLSNDEILHLQRPGVDLKKEGLEYIADRKHCSEEYTASATTFIYKPRMSDDWFFLPQIICRPYGGREPDLKLVKLMPKKVIWRRSS